MIVPLNRRPTFAEYVRHPRFHSIVEPIPQLGQHVLVSYSRTRFHHMSFDFLIYGQINEGLKINKNAHLIEGVGDS
jgi:hypothetical protein